MRRARFKPLDDAALVTMSERMRPIDRLEARALSGGVPLLEQLRAVARQTKRGTACYVDGELVCIFGRIDGTLLTAECFPWMVATDALERPGVTRLFVRLGSRRLLQLLRGMRKGSNMVYEGNARTIRWLRFVGFRFSGEPVMVGGLKFLPFSMEL